MSHNPLLRRIAALVFIEPSAWTVARTADDWGSHLPVLLGLSILASPRSVVELGSGTFSTALFTDKRYFPTLERFRSVEDNPDWYARVKEATSLGPGETLELVADIPQWIRTSGDRLDGLIFVDSGKRRKDRIDAIKATFEHAEGDSVIAVHDFEYRGYKASVPPSWPVVAIRTWRPMTGIASRDGALLDGVRRMGELIQNNRHVRPTDLEAWFDIFQALR